MPRKKQRTESHLFDVWLQRKMKEFSLSPEEVANAVDVDEGTVSRWLKEGRRPERRHVARLSLLFRVAPSDILKITDPEEFIAEVKKAEQEHSAEDVAIDISDVLEQVPDLRGFLGDLARLTPERRAAIVMLARSPEE